MANERACAESFVSEVLSACRTGGFEHPTLFVVLDRASVDGTREILQRVAQQCPELRVVEAQESRGVVDAYRRGYREALAADVDWILEIDAGYSHRPEELGRFLEHTRAGADCVFATRFSRGGRYEGGLSRRYLVSRGGSALARLLLGSKLSDMTSGYQLFSRNALAQILAHGLRSNGPFFQAEMKFHARGLHFREVPITYRPTASAVRRGSIADALRVLARLTWGRFSERGAQRARPVTPP